MLKYFILAVLCLVLYQFMYHVIEGLETEGGDSATVDAAAPATTTTGGDTSPSTNNNNGNCATMSLTDRNVFLLNDRVNALQVQYSDLSGNIILLNKQMEDMMKQNENAASDMVGNEPLDISTGGNDMPQEVGTDTSPTTDTISETTPI